MRITIVQGGDFRQFPLGGMVTMLRHLLPYLARKMEIRLVGTTCGSEPVGSWTDIDIDGVGFPFFPVALTKPDSRFPIRARLVAGLYRYRRQILEPPVDVLYVQGGEAGLPFLGLGRRPPIALYLPCTTNPFLSSKYAWVRNAVVSGFLYLALYRIPFRRVERILVSSARAEFEDFCTRHPLLATKSVSIPAGFRENVFSVRDRAEVRRILGIGPDAKIVLFVGRLERQKNVLFLLEAFAILGEKSPGASLVMIGTGSQQREVEERTRSYRLEDRVRLLGRKSPAEIACWMNAADVLVLPSVWEAFGIVGLEAMACGTPVVASRVGGMPDLIVDGETGYLVDPLNPKAFAEAAAQGLQRSSLMRQQCRARAEPFTTKVMSERIRTELVQMGSHAGEPREPTLTARDRVCS